MKKRIFTVLITVTALILILGALTAFADDERVYLDDYTLVVTDAEDITAMRIAPGEWTTSIQIKNAPGVLNLDSSVIRRNRDDEGTFRYLLSDGGVFTVWFKCSDGTQYISPCLASDITPYVENDGITVTVNNLYGVKDFFLSKGTYTTYQDVKNNTTFLASNAKITGHQSFTYVLPEEGDYTVWIRYNDTSKSPSVFYITCDVLHPVCNIDGRRIGISNLDGIKVLRVAPGTYTTVSQIKAAEGSRSFSAAEVLANLTADGEYGVINTVADGGSVYTFGVQYRNGYTEIHTVTLHKLVPAYTVNGDAVTFTGLTGLQVFRYAPGTFTTATDIKNAAGSQFIRPADVKNDTISLDGLDGKYTFLIQYYEGSMTIVTLEFSTVHYVQPGSAVMKIGGVNVSNYRIVKPSGCMTEVSQAAEKLRDFIRTATGKNLTIVSDSTSATTYEICVGKTNRENGQINRSSMADLEFTVTLKGNKLFFAGAVDAKNRYATYYSVYRFAEKELGFHFYQDDCIVCRPLAEISIGSGYKFNEKPGFETRTMYMEGGWEDCFLNDDYYSGVNWVHELYDWVSGTSGNILAPTPCLTNEQNIQKVINKAKSLLASHPGSNAIWISMNDSEEYCTCSACEAVYRAEGSRSGSIIRLCNRVSSAISSQYPNVTIFTLAYNYAVVPPKSTKPASNVVPYYCTIANCPSHPYNASTCTMNKDVCTNITNWGKISSKVYVWDYACNFAYAMSPLPDFYSLRQNFNWFYANKVRGMFINAVDRLTGDFNELRAYLISQLMFKPNMSEEEYFGLMDSFIADYYGDTNLYLRQYIDIIEQVSNGKHFKYSTETKRMFDYTAISNRVDEIEALWTAAYAEAAGNPTYTRRVDIAYQSWFYLKQCATYKSKYILGGAAGKEEYMADNQRLYNNILAYGLCFSEYKDQPNFNAAFSPESW